MLPRSSVRHAAAASLLSTLAAFAQSPETPAPLPPVSWPTFVEKDETGAPRLRAVRVGDVELSPRRLQQGLPFLDRGHVERAVRLILAEDWRQRLIVQGRDPEEFAISDDEVADRVRANFAAAQKQAAVPVHQRPANPPASNPEIARQEILFDKVFMGGPPEGWPEVSKNAIIEGQGENGQKFWDQLAGQSQELPAFWTNLLRGMIYKGLVAKAQVLYPDDRLPAHVVLVVNAREWTGAEAFEQVAVATSPHELELAVRELVVREALRQELINAGAYLDDREFDTAFQAHAGAFVGPFNLEIIAKGFKGYPTLEAYRQRWRLLRSYEALIHEEITDEALAAHAKTYRTRLRNESLHVEFLPFRDPASAETAKRRLADGADWAALRDELDTFPAGDDRLGSPQSNNFAALRARLEESEFTDLVLGSSLANTLLEAREVGAIVGPVAGYRGYYLARHIQRVAQPADGRPIATDDKIREDYVWHRFTGWARDVLRRTTIR